MDDAANRTRLIITIDGPAGTGKSTVAHLLAGRLGLEVLDTGAMYRAASVLAIEGDIDPADGAALAAAVGRAAMRFDWTTDPPTLMLGDRDLSGRIRAGDVSTIVSIVAAQPALRRELVGLQRDIAREHPRLVSEGRDQGSVVFPDADIRFFIDAAVEVRAGRRAAQLAEAGIPADHEEIVGNIVERDRLDSTRSDGPLIKPRGAVVIDTGNLTVEQVVDELERISRQRLAEAGIEP